MNNAADILQQLGIAAPMSGAADARAEWLESRLGKITASNFHRIGFTMRGASDKDANGGLGKLTQGAETYMYEIISEHLTGQRAKAEFTAAATDWGNEYEPEAADVFLAKYDLQEGYELANGSLFTASQIIGGTPDRLVVGMDGCIVGGLEIKCPFNPGIHVRNLVTEQIPSDYYEQVIGYIWLTGAQFWYFVSYDPRTAPSNQLMTVRLEATDPDTAADIAALEKKVLAFEAICLQRLKDLDIENV